MSKMLNESAIKKVEALHESYKVKTLASQDLVDLIESKEDFKALPVMDSKLEATSQMLQLEEKYIAEHLNESNTSGDIATFTKRLQPLLRRVIPNMIALEIAGVQPVDSADTAIFAIKSKYAGSKTTPINDSSILVVHDGVTALVVGDDVTGANGGTGVVKYVEGTKAIVEVTSGSFSEGEKFDKGTSYTADANDNTISAIYSTETAFKQILKDYSGPYTTAAGEALGDTMNQIKMTIEKLPVAVKTRALKAEFTTELVQDMRAMHGENADEHLMNFLVTEINLDLDQEILAEYKAIATAKPDFKVATTTDSQGRWSLEMYAGLYQRILKSSNDLAKRNRRGKGNILVCTSGVISALEALGKFKTTSYEQAVKTGETPANTYVGTLANGMKVYQDWFSDGEYAMVIYKGEGLGDAGLFYSPYQPLWFAEAVDATTLQPVIGVKSRYGITRNTLMDEGTSSSFAEMFICDFSSTPLS